MDLVFPPMTWPVRGWPGWRAWWHSPQELRIDVSPPPSDSLAQELDALYERLYRSGDRLFGLCTRALPCPRFAMHYREADGEWYVYVEDRVAGGGRATRCSTGSSR